MAIYKYWTWSNHSKCAYIDTSHNREINIAHNSHYGHNIYKHSQKVKYSKKSNEIKFATKRAAITHSTNLWNVFNGFYTKRFCKYLFLKTVSSSIITEWAPSVQWQQDESCTKRMRFHEIQYVFGTPTKQTGTYDLYSTVQDSNQLQHIYRPRTKKGRV